MRFLGGVLTIFLAPMIAWAQEFTTLKGHGGPIMAIAVSEKGQVASASFDNSVGLWEGRTPRWLEGHDAAVTALAYEHGRLVSGGDDFAVIAWDETGGREIGRHKGKVTDIAVSPDGAVIASASWDGTIGLLGRDGTSRALAPGRGGVNAVAFGPDGKRLFAATTGGALLSLSLDGREKFPLVKHGFGINELVLGPGAAWLAYGAVDGVTRIIDPQTGRLIADFSLDRRPILALAFHPGTAQLAVGDGHGYIMVIDTKIWRITRDFRATRRGPIWALDFSPDGRVIYAGGLDDVVYAWPVALLDTFEPVVGQERRFLKPAQSMGNGERQFMRKCSICHALEPGPSRKAGPTLHGLFGRVSGQVKGYPYSPVLQKGDIVWSERSIDALFDLGPDHYIPGSKMPMQRITRPEDRRDLVEFLKQATR